MHKFPHRGVRTKNKYPGRSKHASLSHGPCACRTARRRGRRVVKGVTPPDDCHAFWILKTCSKQHTSHTKLGPSSTRFGSKSTNYQPHLGKLRPKSAKSGPASSNFGSMFTEGKHALSQLSVHGQLWFRRLWWQKLGRVRAQLDGVRSKLASFRPSLVEFGLSLAESPPERPIPGHH